MKLRSHVAAVMLLLLAGGALSACRQATRQSGPTVVVVVVESLRHDYPELAAAPTLLRLAAEGGRARTLLPVFPANSLPNQAAIATGALAGRSGVVDNRFFDRRLNQRFEGEPEERDVLLREPIWVTAERQGAAAGLIHWGGAAAPYDGVLASRVSQLGDDVSDEQRVDELVSWLAETGDDAPRLILVYLDELDDVAHRFGPEAPDTLEAVRRVDRQVQTIVEAVTRHRGRENTTLFVLGDHGMASVERCVYLKPYLARKNIGAATFAVGATANIYLTSGSSLETARSALAAERELFAAHLPADLPAAYGYVAPERVGDLVLVAEPGTYFRDRGDEPMGPAPLAGVHGYPPENPDMMATLLAWGRGVPAGHEWEQLRIVDLHPTVCALLGITPPEPGDGAPISGIQSLP